MRTKAIPRGWIVIGDSGIRLDQVIAVQDNNGDFGLFSVIVLAGGASLSVETHLIPANFLTLVAKSQLRSEE